MKVKVKFFATLREGRGKIAEYQVEETPTVKQVLDHFAIKEEEVAILYVNGLDTSLNQELSEGDVISIFPPVGGG